MRFKSSVLIGLILWASELRADDTSVASKIESVGLFKNGLALINRSVVLDGPGSYRIDDMQAPVHGTFFIESTNPIVAKTKSALVDSPLELGQGNLQDQFAGSSVVIYLKDQDAPIQGQVATLLHEKDPDQPAANRYSGYPYSVYQSIPNHSLRDRFLVLETGDAKVLVDESQIISIKAVGGEATKKWKTILQLNLNGPAEKQTVRITYLAKGLAWAPSYRVQLLDDKTLSISQNAVIKNELADLSDVEMSLISGFPNIGFSQVTSPLSLSQNLNAFFSQLSSQNNNGNRAAPMVQQQAIMTNSFSGGNESAVAGLDMSSDDGVDVHYESIHQQSLELGSAMSLDVATGQAEYERIVEWNVPDTRDAYGRVIQDYQRQADTEKYDDSAWDAVKFRNPLPFAMTTAPATFMRDGKFLGQQLSKWISKGGENTLRITKALSIRTHSTEREQPSKEPQMEQIAKTSYRKPTIKGTLSVKNLRKTESKIQIKRQFSGDLIKADDKPESTLLEEGAWSVNRRNELTWMLTLKPGEEKNINYEYTVFVAN